MVIQQSTRPRYVAVFTYMFQTADLNISALVGATKEPGWVAVGLYSVWLWHSKAHKNDHFIFAVTLLSFTLFWWIFVTHVLHWVSHYRYFSVLSHMKTDRQLKFFVVYALMNRNRSVPLYIMVFSKEGKVFTKKNILMPSKFCYKINNGIFNEGLLA